MPAKTPLLCADWESAITNQSELENLWQEANRVAPHTRINPLHWTWTLQCAGWPGQPSHIANPPHNLAIRNAPPILLLNAREDVATPYTWARNVTAQIPDSVLLTYEGALHGVYSAERSNSSCAVNAVDTYFIDKTLPLQGITCPSSN